MKKTLHIFSILIAILIACMSLFACAKDDKIIHYIRTVGTFSDHRVDFVKIEYLDADVSDTTKKYYVDDIYITTCPTSAYKFLVYINENDYLYLTTAYEQGLITHDDLILIAEAEKPFDNLKEL